jgi:thiamine kinase-like enzyme
MKQSIVPPNKRSTVEKALRQTFPKADVFDISLLGGGLSASPVFKIIVDAQPYVLKLDNTSYDLTGAYKNMEMASKAGIAPQLLYLDLKDGVTITPFIENKPLRAVFPTPEALLSGLAQTIRSIHAMPPIPTQNSLKHIIASLIQQAKASPIYTDAIFEDIFDYFDVLQSAYPFDDPDKVTSHNDLNPNNLICDGQKIWVVDWGAAFLNDRYVDLAIAANFFVDNQEQEQLLLNTYFGGTVTPYQQARFFAMRQICRLIYAITMLRLGYNAEAMELIADPAFQSVTLQQVGELMRDGKLSISSSRGQWYFAKASINEALRDMRSPRFEASMKALTVLAHLKKNI